MSEIENDGRKEEMTKKERKEAGRELKRQKIKDSGGVRPRQNSKPAQSGEGTNSPKNSSSSAGRESESRSGTMEKSREFKKRKNQNQWDDRRQQHRFGKVMDSVPCRNKPRLYTVSLALPGSVLSTCQTRELRTHLVGQIARAATIYHVDEIVVFDDKLGRRRGNETNDKLSADPSCSFMARLLQYCECPQYLRRHYFPKHPDLTFVGLLPPIDAPHHVRLEDRSKYREGVVLEKKGSACLVNCGIRNRPVEIDHDLKPGIRCTVELDPKAYGKPGKLKGKVVSPSAPREDDGTYWGYTTRLATSIRDVFDSSPFEGGYDLKVGTSERGDTKLDSKQFKMPQFKHAIIVFGGVAGIEECVDADESFHLPGSKSRELFDLWLNICPFQGSRTIRTEEAVMIGLARLNPFTSANIEPSTNSSSPSKNEQAATTPVVYFSDNAVSDESSESDSD